jgi:hypothetical protein
MAAGEMVSLSVATSVACDIDTTDQLIAFEGYSKVFIANGSILRVADFINTKLGTADITLSAGNVHPTKGTVLTGGTSGAVMVTDYVTVSNGAGNIYGYNTKGTFTSIETVTGTDLATSSPVEFVSNATPVANPHWYTWAVYPGGTFGTLPEKAYLGCLYRGRAVLSGNPLYPNQWYMSRQANPWDWAYAAADAQSPVAGNNADAGECGDIIRCLIPYGDDYLVFGCTSEIWVMRGDPAAGGSMDRLTNTTGIFGPYSWCWDTMKNLYFWGSQGIYRLTPDFASIENLTQDVLPSLIKDEAANPSTHRITLGFDQIRNGIVVSVTLLADGTNSCYWYDIRTGGFFPEEYPEEAAAYSQFYYNANATSLADMLVGGKDGYIRVFKDTAKDDDAGSSDEAISSHALIGPSMIGQDDDSYGRMKTLAVIAGRDTDAVTCDVYVKETAEEVVDSYAADSTPFYTTTLSAGRERTLRPRARGTYIGIAFENTTSTQTWSFEKAVADIKAVGEI